MRRGKEAREARQQSAMTLKEKRSSLTIEQQLKILANRPGQSTKEIKRLMGLIEKQKS